MLRRNGNVTYFEHPPYTTVYSGLKLPGLCPSTSLGNFHPLAPCSYVPTHGDKSTPMIGRSIARHFRGVPPLPFPLPNFPLSHPSKFPTLHLPRLQACTSSWAKLPFSSAQFPFSFPITTTSSPRFYFPPLPLFSFQFGALYSILPTPFPSMSLPMKSS